MLNYFQSVKSVLDDSLTKICERKGLSEEQAKTRISSYLQKMSEEWFSGKQPTIAYDDPFCRFAYLYCHVPVNANLCEIALRKTCSKYFRNFSENGSQIRVCAFGGGPGTELLGLAKFAQKLNVVEGSGEPMDLSVTIMDAVNEWGENVSGLSKAITNSYRKEFGKMTNWPMVHHFEFRSLDMTKTSSFANITNAYDFDLYILNFVVSEIVDERNDLKSIVSLMSSHAHPEARFLFIDRGQNIVRSAIDEIIEAAGLKGGLSGDAGQPNMDHDEQVDSDYGQYPKMIGRKPRTDLKNSYFKLAHVP